MKIDEIKEFDRVLLKDGRAADVMEVFPNGSLVLDIGDSPETWETLYDKSLEDVEKIINKDATIWYYQRIILHFKVCLLEM